MKRISKFKLVIFILVLGFIITFLTPPIPTKAYTVQTDTNIKIKLKRKNACRYTVLCFSKYPLEKIKVNKKKYSLKKVKTIHKGKYVGWHKFDVIKGKKSYSIVKVKNIDGKSKTKRFKIKWK